MIEIWFVQMRFKGVAYPMRQIKKIRVIIYVSIRKKLKYIAKSLKNYLQYRNNMPFVTNFVYNLHVVTARLRAM